MRPTLPQITKTQCEKERARLSCPKWSEVIDRKEASLQKHQAQSFKLKWNLQLPTWRSQMLFWPETSFMVRWDKDLPFWPQWVEKCKALKCFQTKHGGGSVIVCCYLTLDGIMKKADYPQIFQLLLKSTSSSEKLDIRRQCPKGTMTSNTHQNIKLLDCPSQNLNFNPAENYTWKLCPWQECKGYFQFLPCDVWHLIWNAETIHTVYTHTYSITHIRNKCEFKYERRCTFKMYSNLLFGVPWGHNVRKPLPCEVNDEWLN